MTRNTIEQAMQIALAHHQAGRLAEAEAIYRRVLAQFPDHAEALRFLGVLACQMGHAQAAIELIGRAIAVNPAVAQNHLDLGNSLKHLGRVEEAADAYRRAAQRSPGNAAAFSNLGGALWEQGRLDEAIDACRRAIALKPDLAVAYNNLGNALKDQGCLDEAINAYRQAIHFSPGYAVAYNNLGRGLTDQGRLEEAIEAYQRALQLQPDLAAAYVNLGSALREQGRLDGAIDACRRAIALKPDLTEAHNNLGIALNDQGRREEAIDAYRRALQLRPGNAEAHINLGNALNDQGRHEEAIDVHRRALQLRPGYAEAHNNLGNALRDQGRLGEAIASYKTALALKPDLSKAASNLLSTLHYHPEHDARSILQEHRRWARQFAEPLAAQIRPHPNDRIPDRRLRVGYVSPDFGDHAVGHLLMPLLSHHDRQDTDVVCYSDVRASDAVTEKLKSLADRWHSVVGMSDQQLAELVRAEGIDILVDLAVHTAHNRMLVFARKPAPVQVTMLGMPATTGLATMDYRLTDPYLDPPGTSDGDYTEQSIRLPHCYWCYNPPEAAPPLGPLPALENGFVTFGCLNNFAKVSRPALTVWLKVLQSLPGARLVIHSRPGSHLEAAQRMFHEGGITSDRVVFAARVPRVDYLARYHEIDLGLDPFPYNGHTTTLDSLWMGVPVVTLAGGTAVGRGGTSILSNVGLPELIARTPEQYVAIAVEWASDLARLASLRAGLRERMSALPLLDGKQYAADVEAAFREMWKRWCRSGQK